MITEKDIHISNDNIIKILTKKNDIPNEKYRNYLLSLLNNTNKSQNNNVQKDQDFCYRNYVCKNFLNQKITIGNYSSSSSNHKYDKIPTFTEVNNNYKKNNIYSNLPKLIRNSNLPNQKILVNNIKINFKPMSLRCETVERSGNNLSLSPIKYNSLYYFFKKKEEQQVEKNPDSFSKPPKIEFYKRFGLSKNVYEKIFPKTENLYKNDLNDIDIGFLKEEHHVFKKDKLKKKVNNTVNSFNQLNNSNGSLPKSCNKKNNLQSYNTYNKKSSNVMTKSFFHNWKNKINNNKPKINFINKNNNNIVATTTIKSFKKFRRKSENFFQNLYYSKTNSFQYFQLKMKLNGGEIPKFAKILLLSKPKVEYKSYSEILKEYSLNKMINYAFLENTILNTDDIYYYSITGKSYRNQFKEYFKHRLNWKLFYQNDNTSNDITINFHWKYFSNKVNYNNYKYENQPRKKLKMINLFERNFEIGNKRYMFINLINYCDKININVFEVVPLTILINNSNLLEFSLTSLKEIIEFVEKNYKNNNDIITNKKYNEEFWFDKNYDNISNQYIYINKNFISDKNYWIIKPADLYQGLGIEIFNSYDEIQKYCKTIFKGIDKSVIPEFLTLDSENSPEKTYTKKTLQSTDDFQESDEEKDIIIIENIKKNNKKKTYLPRMYCSNEIIIQKYLDNPLLYNGRKFDIRCYVLIDSNLNLFFCREGHLKGSSELYNLKNTNKFIHVTNYSLQKKNYKFEIYESGNEISYTDFKNFMVKEKIPYEKFEKMINDMKFLIEVSFKAVGNKLLKSENVLCFEIFGYDFILDNEFKPWILEINNNPGLGISSPVIAKLVPRMLDDAFRITIDKVFNTKYDKECFDSNGKYKSKYHLEGFSDEENVFEFLCNIK